jgi:hypothetical protein
MRKNTYKKRVFRGMVERAERNTSEKKIEEEERK